MGLDAFHAAAHQAADAVRKGGARRWFIDCDTDADGLCAAAIVVACLRRLGHRYTVRASREKTAEGYRRVLDQEAEGWFFLDKGTSHVGALARHAQETECLVVVLDHHNLPPGAVEGVFLVNPRAAGLDGGRDACSSTTALAFALALLGDEALKWAPVAISGAIGDWQHRGPGGQEDWAGWNAELVTRARTAGTVVEEPLPRLIGVDLAEALARQGLPGLEGRGACAEFLGSLEVDATQDPEDLDRETRMRLVSAVALKHLEAGRAPDGLVQATLWDPRLGTSLRQAFRIVDACGRGGHGATGLAYLLGDARAAEEARDHFDAYRAALADALEVLREEGTRRHRALQVAWTRDAAYTGMVGGLGMTTVLERTDVPLVVLAARDDGDVQVSTRGTHGQVAAGLDLGAAVQRASRAVGREGGGHPIAAGAVVPADGVDAFLEALDVALEEGRKSEAPALGAPGGGAERDAGPDAETEAEPDAEPR